MSEILYYSNYCEKCKKLLQTLSTTKLKEQIHFLCIDKRKRGSNNATYIILENGQEIILPPTITKVPALLLLNRGHHVLFGDQIYQHLQPREISFTQEATNNQGEPECFTLSSGGSNSMMGVVSDNFSFLDQSSDSLSAKGDGGLRQLHQYATLAHVDKIETPPDNYVPDKIGEVSLETLQQQRNQEIPQRMGPPPI